MADTARYDQFRVFMRKIGYSVGLENTLERLGDLADVYNRAEHLTLGDWRELVVGRWKLKGDNIGDFFNALGVINRTKSRLDVLPGLDLLAICADGLPSEKAREARATAFLSMLIEHDGEIFLNCLASEFEDGALVARLTELIEYKRAVLFQIFRNPGTQQEIARFVGIDRQARNIGGAGGGRTLSELRRREPLANRTESLKGPGVPAIEISDDYLRKVPARRRDWAVSIGLWHPDAGLTSQARELLALLGRMGLTLPSGAVILWPFSHEISRLRLNPTSFDGKIIEFWDLVRMSVVGAGGVLADGLRESDATRAIGTLTAQISRFRELNRPKAMLRREYPLTIAFPAVAARYVAESLPVPDLPALVERERAASSALEVRSSRNSIGTLTFRGKA